MSHIDVEEIEEINTMINYVDVLVFVFLVAFCNKFFTSLRS